MGVNANKNDSKFTRDMAEIMWGREVLRNRCLKMPNENVNNLQRLTPRKVKICKDALRYKINRKQNVDDTTKVLRLKKLRGYLTQKIYDSKRDVQRNRA